MVQNLTPKTAYNLIKSDFERAWNCLAFKEKGEVRQGPMFFGFLAMNLLEFVCRLCTYSKPDLIDFSNSLNKIEGKYFIHLPVKNKVKKRGFSLPHLAGEKSNDLLLTLVFDLIRNGLGHLYQPTILSLDGGGQFYLVLRSASDKINLKRNSDHLCYNLDKNGNLRMLFYPEYLLCHIDEAVKRSSLLDKGLTMKYFERSRPGVDVQTLEKALKNGGTSKCFVGKVYVTHPPNINSE